MGEVVLHDDGRGFELAPARSPAELLVEQERISSFISEALEEGKDWGKVPGTSSDALFKPGADRLGMGFGLVPRFAVEAQMYDPAVETPWSKARGKTGIARGYVRYVVRCELVHRDTGAVVGTALGSCSSMESKYIDRSRADDVDHTVLMMAQKRAHVAAIVRAFGLSERFRSGSGASIEGARRQYHGIVREILEGLGELERVDDLRQAFQHFHPDLPDSSSDWEAMDFLEAIAELEKRGRRIFERVRALVDGDAPEDSPAEPPTEAEAERDHAAELEAARKKARVQNRARGVKPEFPGKEPIR